MTVRRDEIETCLFELRGIRSESLDRLAFLARSICDENEFLRKENRDIRDYEELRVCIGILPHADIVELRRAVQNCITRNQMNRGQLR